VGWGRCRGRQKMKVEIDRNAASKSSKLVKAARRALGHGVKDAENCLPRRHLFIGTETYAVKTGFEDRAGKKQKLTPESGPGPGKDGSVQQQQQQQQPSGIQRIASKSPRLVSLARLPKLTAQNRSLRDISSHPS
jgi:hypothetical protein